MRPLSPHSAYLAAYLAEENTTDISQRTTIINDLRTPGGQRKLEAEYPQSDFKRSGGPKARSVHRQDVKRHVDQYQASRNLASGSSMQSAPPPTEWEAPRRSVSPDSRTYLSKVSLEAFRRDNTPKMLNDLNSMRAQRGLHNDYTLDDLKPVIAGRLSNEKDAYEAAQRLRALDQGESRSGFSGPALPSGSTTTSKLVRPATDNQPRGLPHLALAPDRRQVNAQAGSSDLRRGPEASPPSPVNESLPTSDAGHYPAAFNPSPGFGHPAFIRSNAPQSVRSQEKVPDPDYPQDPTKMITKSTRYHRTMVPDPLDPTKMMTKGALNTRKTRARVALKAAAETENS
ncbi:hypothetical protein [Pseudomonas sp. FP603]|uniref:hypothetical protein n=1 Tax=Pseudomonas sp. FP603 TaxID=2954097 RepID=UPI0027351B0D|nr:hypothetical protein [Pseudomonas sp. FP603]WLI10688.1 hypothetical protein PSH65_20910 [Pseudomonas sp. FP603]